MTRLIAFLLLISPALAQEHHGAYHEGYYKGWVNQRDTGCCDNRDCGDIADEDERTRGGKLEVKVEGQWCEVKPWHYLKRGNVPNASVSHICVRARYSPMDLGPCDRLLCYQPRPGI